MSIEKEINTSPEEQVENQDASKEQPEDQQTPENETVDQPESQDVVQDEASETTIETPDQDSPEQPLAEAETVSHTPIPPPEAEADPPEAKVEEAEPVNTPDTEQQETVLEVKEDAPPPAEKTGPEKETPSEDKSEAEVAETQAVAEVPTEEAESEEVGEAAEEEAVAEAEKQEPEFDPDLMPLIQKIDETLASKDIHVLEGVSAQELTRLLLAFGQQEDIRQLIPKVGLIKRSFDAIKDQAEISDEDRSAFMTALEAFNQRRSDFHEQEEISRAHNSERKKELLLKLKALVEAQDPMSVQQEVRNIQDEWKMIGLPLKEDVDLLNRQYREQLDEFYRQRDIHYEMLDYDRKINLQEKEKLIAEAANLIPQEDERHDPIVWKQKMDMFTQIQQKWRSIGHVPRSEMDRINSAYREAIDKFFEIREGFKKLQEKIREENAEKKEEILRMMEKFRTFEADKPKAWNDATRELRTYQEAWKQIGQAPTRKNNELWSRYREICDAFFGKKSEFFKQFDELRSENLEQKKALCEKAEALKDSTEWEKAARELKQLQREWKNIGPVPERYSNKLWGRFRAACDTFFENRRKHYESLHADEYANLAEKKGLIEEVKKLSVEEAGSPEAAIQKIKEIQARWKEIGKVPYKEKDVIWEEFRAAIDEFFNNLSLKREELRDMKLKSSLNMMSDPDRRARTIRSKISRLRRKIQQGQEKVDQYSINIQYISKGKAGDPLRNQIQKEIDREKQLIEEWKARIKELNELLKNPPKEKTPPPPKQEETTVAEPAEENKEQAEAPAAEEAAKAPAAEEVAEAPAAEEAAEAPAAEEVAEAPAAEEEEAVKEEEKSADE